MIDYRLSGETPLNTWSLCNVLTKCRVKTYNTVKRIFDVVFASFLFIVLSPFMLILLVLVSIASKGHPIYRHRRIGRNGRPFFILKYRTMVLNADQMMTDFTDEQKEEWFSNFRLDNDPRVTRIGRFLRKTKLDELPQLINVLRNELSIVGPRGIALNGWMLLFNRCSIKAGRRTKSC